MSYDVEKRRLDGLTLPVGFFSFRYDVVNYRKLVGKIPVGGTLVEIGSFKGKSLCSVSDIIKSNSLKVFSIDTFEGTESDNHDEAWTKGMFQIFTDNIEKFGITDKVTVLKGMSSDMVKHLENESADLVFIDGDHTYEGCYKDIVDYLPIVKIGGVLSGHDYNSTFKGVIQATSELLGEVETFGKLINNSIWYKVKS